MAFARSSATARSIELAWGGKLPSMGDFVWSDGHTALRTQLEGWLLNGMHQLRLTHGDNWQSGFDEAPMWNFIVPEGALNQGCAAGCVSPSCDRVGRRFPFIVAYGFPEGLPDWLFPKMVNLVPGLLSRTGMLLFNGIRRRWPREMLISLIEQALTGWQELLPSLRGPNTPPNDSIIMDILMNDSHGANPAVTVPNDRFTSYPWIDVATRLGVGSPNSFWWTNGAGSASLKAFSYGAHPDTALMNWIFGPRQPQL